MMAGSLGSSGRINRGTVRVRDLPQTRKTLSCECCRTDLPIEPRQWVCTDKTDGAVVVRVGTLGLGLCDMIEQDTNCHPCECGTDEDKRQ